MKEKLTLDEKGDAGEAFTAAAVYPHLNLVEPMQRELVGVTDLLHQAVEPISVYLLRPGRNAPRGRGP